MDRAAATLDTLNALELRVLAGPQGGARAPLAAGKGCVLAAEAGGHSAGADIVLREDQGAPARVRLTAELTHALIEVLHGEVRLGDQVLSAGAQAPWARHVPLHIGSSVVAFGLACEDEWTGAGDSSGTADAPADDTAVAAAPTPAPLRRRAEVWLAATGAGVLLACAGALYMTHVAAAPRPALPVDPAPLAAALKTSEFAALQLESEADGRLELRGRLATLAQRNRLDAWLAARQAAPALDVQVDEAVAREVTEVFRINGIAVQARTAGPGRIVAEAAERDADRLAKAEDVVRRDVRGLEKLSVNNTAVPLPPPAPPVVDDPGKRIASLVPGDPAYVVTVDGARYFVGALLPTGHRITQVAQQQVTLERDGRKSTLNF